MVKIVLVLLILMQCNDIYANFFRGQVGFPDLLTTDKHHLLNLERYVSEAQEKLDEVNRFIDSISKEHNEHQGDLEDFVTNPIRAFSLIKRLVKTWPEIMETLKNNKPADSFSFRKDLISSFKLSYPDRDDFEGAVLALSRLQEAYELDIEKFTDGIIHGTNYSRGLSWEECYHIGFLLNYHDNKLALLWIEETKRKHLLSEERSNKTLYDLYDHLFDNYFKLGRVAEAKVALKLMEELYPGPLISERLNKLNSGIISPDITFHDSETYDVYKKTCRDEVPTIPSQQKLLRCRYTTGPSPFLKLAPFKMEEISFDPLITVYHNAITDTEIDHLIEKAKPNMGLSGVFADGDHEKNKLSQTRVSKTTFMDHSKSIRLMKILIRLSHLTGLDMGSTELPQITNYGIGGVYEPHLDSFPNPKQHVNRIASAMFYLTDVEIGGSTAFNELGINVKAEKGKLVYWENLHSGGAIDYRTRHAGCPVVIGSKWIMNVWIHNTAEIFTRPCKLTNDNGASSDYEFIKYK